MRFEDTVLARRFTIICLVAMIFGMTLANLVISRPAHASKYDVKTQCLFKSGQECQAISQF